VAEAVATCTAPQVFGVYGDWGTGKTSFLYQLSRKLVGRTPQDQPDKNPVKTTWSDRVTLVWFEAWRYQHEPSPIVALLQEIRTQLPWYAKALEETRKLASVSIRSALQSFDAVARMIGLQTIPIDAGKIQKIGERWEQDNLATTLPSNLVRQQLEHALGTLLGGSGDNAQRLVVLVDDLDRCEPESAYRLLEGIKIYLNLPNCVFVLGVNQDVIESAVAGHLPKQLTAEERARRAREYVEKLCQTSIHLPLVHEPAELLKTWLPKKLPGRDALCEVVRISRCLPANPRSSRQ
jgi:hypothetical protein